MNIENDLASDEGFYVDVENENDEITLENADHLLLLCTFWYLIHAPAQSMTNPNFEDPNNAVLQCVCTCTVFFPVYWYWISSWK